MPRSKLTYTLKRARWIDGNLIVTENPFTSFAEAMNYVRNMRVDSLVSVKIYDERDQICYSAGDESPTYA